MAYYVLYLASPENVFNKMRRVIQHTECTQYFAAVCPKIMLNQLHTPESVKRSRFYALDTAYLDQELVSQQKF